tara:strand:- start:3158 stop:4396 length:1239 start_codon:yes stop_codon:yes gene_type:complete
MELNGCPDQWVDVFVTKPADDPRDGSAYTFDDEFCCTVQSVEFDPQDDFIIGSGHRRAYVTENDSEWIMPTWSSDVEYGSAAAKSSAYTNIQVGDLVRIGGVPHTAFTDYLTVLEIREVYALCNATSGKVQYEKKTNHSSSAEGQHMLATPTSSSVTVTETLTTSHQKVLSKNGIAHIALRVNASINCSKLPSNALRRDEGSVFYRGWPTQPNGYQYIESTHRQKVVSSLYHTNLEERQHAFQYLSTPSYAFPEEDTDYPSENYFYPLYRAKNWTQGKELVARLDHGIKQVAAVKLLGYTLTNKRQVGATHAHEMITDDFLILRIKELDGQVISNNKYAHGAFAILRAGDTSNNIVGATEFSAYEPSGIVCVPVHSTSTTLKNLTIEITDRNGKQAHFGRLHLWFKLLVTHG